MDRARVGINEFAQSVEKRSALGTLKVLNRSLNYKTHHICLIYHIIIRQSTIFDFIFFHSFCSLLWTVPDE
jgi:hypothetical protein